ncbi:MAG TPA: glycosyltransferase family 2 protein [Patescibacteria group bacterium]|nr:glycosyltransferase family 2 protein [Patescibacteria group bacterium]
MKDQIKRRFSAVSVIVLNYNGKDLTAECIESVLKTNYPRYDIVLVDNCSTDDSYKYFKAKYKSNPKITVLKTDRNRQFTGGFNFGARHAEGDTIALLSNDIVVDPEWITEMIAVQETDKYLVQPKILSYDNRRIIDVAGGSYNIFGIGSAIGRGTVDTGQYDYVKQLDYTCATMIMINRLFFLKLGGYDEWFVSHYEDVDLCLRAKKHGGSCVFAWKSKLYHKGSITYKRYVTNEKVLYDIRKNRVRVIVKNYTGIEKMLRILLLCGSFAALSVYEIIFGKWSHVGISLRAITAGFRYNKSILSAL